MATEEKVVAEKAEAKEEVKEKKAAAPKKAVAKKVTKKAKTVAAKVVAAKKKADIKSFDTIVRPVITEKTMDLIQNQNKVTVEVDPKANRAAIKIAFEAVFGVKVANVNISNVRGKETRRGGKYKGSVPGYRKAIVTLAEGQALDLFKE